MYAVAGRWTLAPSMSDRQDDALHGIVAGVRQLPGFVRGSWSRDVDDPSVDLTYIVFQTLAQAEAFRHAVEQNAPAQQASGVGRDELALVEIVVDA